MNARLLVVLLALLWAAPLSEAGWGPNGCAAVAAPVGFTGWEASDEPHILGYFRDGIQVAAYNSRTHIYRSYDALADRWGPAQRAPWAGSKPMAEPIGKPKASACPCLCGCGDSCDCAEKGPCEQSCPCPPTLQAVARQQKLEGAQDCAWQEADGTRNYGVDRTRIRADDRAGINGRPATKKELFDAMGAPEKGKIPDDGKLLRLTIVAEDNASLDKLRASLSPALGDLAPKLCVQWYTKDAWAIRPEYGFKFDTLPAVLLQEPEKAGVKGGRAVLQAPIAGDTAPLVAAIRQKIDGFDPSKVPNLGGPMNINPGMAIAACALAAVGYFVLKQ